MNSTIGLPVATTLVAVLGLPLLGGMGLSLWLTTFELAASLPAWRRTLATFVVHAGTWLLAFVVALVLLQRGWFAAALATTLQWVVLQSHRAKQASLKEPFLVQDFEYFIDAIRHPRLYLPFFGIWLAIGASTMAVAAIVAFFHWDPWLPATLGVTSFALTVTSLALTAVVALAWGIHRLPDISLCPRRDVACLGLWSTFWAYARYPATPIDTRLSPRRFSASPGSTGSSSTRPHLVVVQGESFFDPRRWTPGLDTPLLTQWDALCRDAVAYGPLNVPAWGANTIRSECAFLTGLSPTALGMHRFMPYRQLSRQNVPSLAHTLKSLGYRTVVLHPYPARFYARHLVMPKLGFERFDDIVSFDPTRDRDGPFIGDAALATRVAELLADDDPRPLMVFIITMESHGPFHLETSSLPPAAPVTESTDPLPADVDHELSVYLRHLANTDAMIGRLAALLGATARPGVLCAYGDHVPPLGPSYRHFGEPLGQTDYLLWSTEGSGTPSPCRPLRLDALGEAVLDAVLSTGDVSPSPPSKESP